MKTDIGFFTLPTDTKLNKQWKNVISQYRRKGTGDNFNIEKVRICEHHFKREENKVSLGRGIKSLNKNVVPSVFSFKTTPVPTRKTPKKRTVIQKCRRVEDEQMDDEEIGEQMEEETAPGDSLPLKREC
jgi:hypothetical protein